MNPLDAALNAASPLVPMPRCEPLPALAAGSKRFIAAADGLYVEARNHALSVRTRISDSLLPYGPTGNRIGLAGGVFPSHLVREFVGVAEAQPEREHAAAIVLNEAGDDFELIWPEVASVSAGHVRYDDSAIPDDRLLVDIHSHGRLSAYFSQTDNASDLSRQGPYIAVVIGECGSGDPQAVARIVLPPYLCPIDLVELKDAGELP